MLSSTNFSFLEVHDPQLAVFGALAERYFREDPSTAITKLRHPGGYCGHSLRAGFATSAAMAGASTLKIRAQTGHVSDAMLSKNFRGGELFTGNAAGVVL